MENKLTNQKEDTKMKTLTAKVMIANFTDLNDVTYTNSYPVHVFDNGLVLVPAQSTNDYFFDSLDNIEGCGHDVLKSLANNQEIATYSNLELGKIWGNSCSEFGVDQEVLFKIKELIK